MNPSQRITTLSNHIRTNKVDNDEICILLDVIADEFELSERRQDKKLEKIERNLKNISQYLKIQAM